MPTTITCKGCGCEQNIKDYREYLDALTDEYIVQFNDLPMPDCSPASMMAQIKSQIIAEAISPKLNPKIRLADLLIREYYLANEIHEYQLLNGAHEEKLWKARYNIRFLPYYIVLQSMDERVGESGPRKEYTIDEITDDSTQAIAKQVETNYLILLALYQESSDIRQEVAKLARELAGVAKND